MLRLLKKLRRNERGNVLILTALAMPLVVGSAGLAVDTIQWTLWKRQLQRAADSAALAGVYARVQNHGSQTFTQAVNADLTRNQHTGISHGTPAISTPTSTQWTNAVRVELAVSKRLNFSSMFLSSPPTIRAGATAATISTGVYCVVSLEPTSETGITASGNGTLNLGCGMITNSTSLSAAISTGSATVSATPIAAVGNVPPSNNWGTAELLSYTVKQEDPFATLPMPTYSGCKGASNRLSVGSNDTVDLRTAHPAGSVVCVSDMNLLGDVILGSATYVIDGGDFSSGSGAHVTCSGCTIILTNSDPLSSQIGNVKMNAGAEMDMSAPTSGTYNRVLFYQDRRAQSGPSENNIINGNSNSLMSGAFYFPTRELVVNGTSTLSFSCAQFVARNVDFSGSGTISNTCSSYGGDAIMGKHVRLVA